MIKSIEVTGKFKHHVELFVENLVRVMGPYPILHLETSKKKGISVEGFVPVTPAHHSGIHVVVFTDDLSDHHDLHLIMYMCEIVRNHTHPSFRHMHVDVSDARTGKTLPVHK